MNIFTFKSNRESDEAGANIIVSLLRSIPNAKLGLATGQTPVGLYEELVKIYRKGNVSFREVTTYNLDEYAGLGKEDPNSFFAFMEQNFFSILILQGSRSIFPMA